MKIGPLELVVIFIVALIAIGPDKLPAYAQKLGLALREFRKVSADVTKDVRESVLEPLEDARKPLREAIEPLAELDREVRKDIQDIEKDFKNLGKVKPEEKKPETPQPVSEPEGRENDPEAEGAEGAQPADGPDVQPVIESAEETINEATEGERV